MNQARQAAIQSVVNQMNNIWTQMAGEARHVVFDRVPKAYAGNSGIIA